MERRVDYKNEVAVRVEIADCLLSDLLSRLTGASYTGPSTYQDNFTRTYGYDRNGNVTSRGTDTYTYDGNHLSTGTYDANGNLTAGQGQTVTYNLLNLPDTVQTSTHTVAYSYGADGTKLKKTATLTGSHFETETYYAGNLVFQILNLESILIEGGYIDMTGSTPAYRFYVMDHQGNIRAVTDGTGTVLRTNHYDPYGEEVLPVLTSASTLPTSTAGTDAASRYMYGAKEWDSNVSLYDFSARWYNPAGAVSFTTMDPLCEKYYSISPYGYCVNNPIRYIDPFGLTTYYVKGKRYTFNDGEDNLSISVSMRELKRLYNKRKTSQEKYEKYRSSLQIKNGFSIAGDESIKEFASVITWHYPHQTSFSEYSGGLSFGVALESLNSGMNSSNSWLKKKAGKAEIYGNGSLASTPSTNTTIRYLHNYERYPLRGIASRTANVTGILSIVDCIDQLRIGYAQDGGSFGFYSRQALGTVIGGSIVGFLGGVLGTSIGGLAGAPAGPAGGLTGGFIGGLTVGGIGNY